MVKRLCAVAGTLAIAATVTSGAQAVDQTVTATAGNEFVSDDVTVTAGDTVTWTNSGGSHNVHFDGEATGTPAGTSRATTSRMTLPATADTAPSTAAANQEAP